MARPTRVKKELKETTTWFSKQVEGTEVIIALEYNNSSGVYDIIDITDIKTYSFGFSYNEIESILIYN